MRVLHVLHSSLPGLCDYSIRSRSIVRLQRMQGIEPTVVTSACHPNPHPDGLRDEIDGVLHLRTPTYQGSSVPLVREWRMMQSLQSRIESAIRETRPDVVHAHSPVLVGLPALRAAREHGIPCVYEVRDLWESAAVDRGRFGYHSAEYRLARRLETYVIRHADAVVTTCQALRNALTCRIRDTSQLFVVDNGVDVTAVRPEPAASAAAPRWGVQRGPVLACIGTFQPDEGAHLLIDAMAAILRDVPRAHLLIAGGLGGASAALETALRLQVERRHLQAAVTFTGPLSHGEVQQVYGLADLLVYPRVSTRATALATPLGPLEAMAMGTAVISSDLPAMREIIDDGRTGLLFRAGDSGSLARRCIEGLGSADLRSALGGQARRWVAESRQWPALVERYHRIYAEAVAHGSVFAADSHGSAARDTAFDTAIAS